MDQDLDLDQDQAPAGSDVSGYRPRPLFPGSLGEGGWGEQRLILVVWDQEVAECVRICVTAKTRTQQDPAGSRERPGRIWTWAGAGHRRRPGGVVSGGLSGSAGLWPVGSSWNRVVVRQFSRINMNYLVSVWERLWLVRVGFWSGSERFSRTAVTQLSELRRGRRERLELTFFLWRFLLLLLPAGSPGVCVQVCVCVVLVCVCVYMGVRVCVGKLLRPLMECAGTQSSKLGEKKRRKIPPTFPAARHSDPENVKECPKTSTNIQKTSRRLSTNVQKRLSLGQSWW